MHVAREQRRVQLAQFPAALDQFGMSSLALKQKQPKRDAGAVFGARIRASLRKPQALREPAVGDERPGRKSGEIVRRTRSLKLSIKVSHEPVKGRQFQSWRQQLCALRRHPGKFGQQRHDRIEAG